MLRILALCLALSLSGLPLLHAQTVPQSMEQIQLSYAPLVKQSASAVVNNLRRKRVWRNA